MPSYYDWIDKCWIKDDLPSHLRARTLRSLMRRRLLPELIKEIETGNSEVRLYAGMLARRLVVGDFHLMDEFGERVAALTEGKPSAVNRTKAA